MKRYIALLTVCIICACFLCSCGTVKRTLDNNTGFVKYLEQTENYIRSEDWANAKKGLVESEKAWEKLKPMLQIDIDHDYINDIENNFVLLDAFIETREKPDSLSLILLIQQDWDKIGEM